MSSNEPFGPVTMPAPGSSVIPRPAAPVTRFDSLKGRAGTLALRSGPLVMYQVNRIGRTGATGGALLLFTAIFFFSALLPQQKQLSSLEQQLQLARRSGGMAESAPVRLNRFMSALPRRSELPTIAGRVFTLAAASHITLDRGRYELTPMRAGHLAQYRMTFPIKGHYPDIRHFLDAVLSGIPSAAVEGMRIERKAVGEDTVAADLRINIFVRNDT